MTLYNSLVYKEYAEKECNCDGTWYQKLPRVRRPRLAIQNNTISTAPKLMFSRAKRKGQEWTNYKSCK